MLQGHFVRSDKGNVFVTQIGSIENNTAILCLPSLFEELNLSRAIVAKQAKLLAQQGLVCFILDYYGTGDSEGEIEDATVELWYQDIVNTCQWLNEKGIENIILWGVRFGAALMFSLQETLHHQFNIPFQIAWKPITNGKLFAGQFLRIKQANEMLNTSSEKTNWRQHILSGNDTEVAGYKLTAPLLNSLESVVLDKNFAPLSKVIWFELASDKITPATTRFCSGFEPQQISLHSFDCPPFWQVPEIFELPELNSLGLALVMEQLNE